MIKSVKEISSKINILITENRKKACIVKVYRLFCGKFYKTN